MQNNTAFQIDFFKCWVTDDFAFALDREWPKWEVTESDNRGVVTLTVVRLLMLGFGHR